MSSGPLHISRRTAFKVGALTAIGAAWGPQAAAAARPARRARVASRTHVFSRSQLKYGLQRRDYLHKWLDRPLFTDPQLAPDPPASGLLQEPAFQRQQQVMLESGLDGMSFFPQTSGRSQAFAEVAANDVAGFQLLTELWNSDGSPSKSEVVGMAVDSPASWRVDGKVVLTSYNADLLGLPYWRDTLAALRAEYPDQFVFLPSLVHPGAQSPSVWIGKYHAGTLTDDDRETIRQYFRDWAEATDGLYFSAASSIKLHRRLDDDFYRNVLIALMSEVAAEDAFAGKYLGLSAVVGHENPTRIGYGLTEDGTKTFRRSMEVALAASPDVVNIPEWDEENENTSLRPTVYNGRSSMRMMRYYSTRLRGRVPAPLADDDVSLPNLIVSYRKTLSLGEKLEVEVLHVPDRTRGASCQAQVVIEAADGTPLHTSDVLDFDGLAMADQTVTLPSEDFAAHTVLCPRLRVWPGGGEADLPGLHHVELHPTQTWDYKWVKQPVRDLVVPTSASFELSAAGADGARTASATFVCGEPLAYVEVLEDDDTVYMSPPAGAPAHLSWREDAEHVVVAISWQSLHAWRTPFVLPGTVALAGAEGEWFVPDSAHNVPTLDGQQLSDIHGEINEHWAHVRIPRADVSQARFVVDAPGVYQGSVAVADLMSGRIHSIPGEYGFNLVLSRYLSQGTIPDHLGEASATLAAAVLPGSDDSVYHLQAVTESGKTFRSRPVVNVPPSGPAGTVTVYSDTEEAPVAVQLPRRRIPDLDYQFDPARGSVLATSGSREYWGILGGSLAQVTGRGNAETNDSNPFYQNRTKLPTDAVTAPEWVESDGSWALRFNGAGSFISLPQGAIPRRAAYSVHMDLRADDISGKRVLVANKTHYMGSLVVYLVDGALMADFLNEDIEFTLGIDSGLSVAAGEWTSLDVYYDLTQLWFAANGQTSRRIPLPGPGLYDVQTMVGGNEEGWFAGDIKALRIRHVVDE